MPAFCGVYKCSSRSNRDLNLKFFAIPVVRSGSGVILKKLSTTRRKQWIAALKRKDLTEKKLKHLRVCSKHFVSGKSALITDTKSVDWVPSINMGYTNKSNSSDPVRNLLRSQRREIRNKIKEGVALNTSDNVLEPIELTVECKYENEQVMRISTRDCATQTDLKLKDVHILEETAENYLSHSFNNISCFEGNDNKTCFFTGLSEFNVLKVLSEKLQPKIPASNTLTEFQVFIMTLMRYRLDLSYTLLAHMFHTSRQTVSNLVVQCTSVLYDNLRCAVYWPEREDIKRTMPECFKKNFKDTVIVILDCFEISIEKPSDPLATVEAWSNYKHTHTVKHLIGITPQGMISFISKAYGGRCSDKFITENSGVLDHIQIGDHIMVDRGFLVEEQIRLRGGVLEIPVFTRGKSQLHPIDIETTRKISNVRIHVERVIGVLRQKYPILIRRKFPTHILGKEINGVSMLDMILTICCALVNFCRPIISMDEVKSDLQY